MGGLGDLGDHIPDTVREEIEDPGEIAGWETTVALHTMEAGFETVYHSIRGKRCRTVVGVLRVCGKARTGDKGTAEIRLEDYVCLKPPDAGDNWEHLIPPPFVVATPRSDAPQHLTYEASIVDTGADAGDSGIRIKVFSWMANGEPAPRVTFDWHCCVRVAQIVG